MKLLLALSVVLIALSVLAGPSSAESEEPTLKKQVRSLGESIKGAVTAMGEKAKTIIKNLHESEFATKSRNVISEGIQKIKEKFSK